MVPKIGLAGATRSDECRRLGTLFIDCGESKLRLRQRAPLQLPNYPGEHRRQSERKTAKKTPHILPFSLTPKLV